MKWLTALPWRQRNIRECRINGPAPNLFRGKIPSFSDIDRPDWVQQEEKRSPDAEFWQFHFTPDETKTEVDVHALLPRPLIGILEEYLGEYRPRLLHGPDPGTLFLNQEGKAITAAAACPGGFHVDSKAWRKASDTPFLPTHIRVCLAQGAPERLSDFVENPMAFER